MKNLEAVLTAFFFISFSYGYSQGTNVIKNYIHISKSDGLSGNNVTAICDDVYGRIWIGTISGLDIYDSNQMKKPDDFSDMHISFLFDTGNEMLIGTSDFIESYNYDSGVYNRVKYENEDIGYAMSIFRFKDMNIIVAGGTVYKCESGSLKALKKDVPYIYLSVDKFGVLWGLNDDMVYKIDDKFNIVKSYKLKSSDFSPLKGVCIFPDSKGCVWIGTVKDGLYRYNRALDEFYKEELTTLYGIQEIENISSINEDMYDRLWIGHNSKLSVYDYNNNYFKSYMLENNNNTTINTTITKVHRTKRKDMLLGTFFTGFFYIKELDSNMKFYNLAGTGKEISGVTANGIIQDSQGWLWVGTNCIGISILDENGKNVKQIDYPGYHINDDIVALESDKEGNVWAGSMSNGLYKINTDHHITHYRSHINDKNSLSGNTILGLYSINKDSLLIASNKGIDIYHYSTNTFSNIQRCGSQDFAFLDVLAFGNDIYIINFNSLYLYNHITQKITAHTFNTPKLYIQSAYINKEGQLWLGTRRGDLFLFNNGSLVPYLENSTLIISGIVGIQGDDNNNLWLASGNNLFCITPAKELSRYNLSWGLGKNEFNARSSHTDAKGIIYFGISDGLFSFNPLQMSRREFREPILFISDFKIFNELVPVNESSVLKKSINTTDKLILNNKQSFISFDITAIDYNTDNTTSYKCLYQLEGFDENWYEVNPASNEINFTGLTTGKYALHIKLESDNGDILDTRNIDIEVKPPFLLSPFMILIYILLFAVIAWLISLFIKKQRTAKKLVNQSKLEQAEMTRMNAMKLDFFTYISHEFKTPLAIISTLQNEILPFSNEQDSDAEIFKRNVKRLEYLINQLMDFRNIESQHALVEIKKYDIIRLLREVYEAFSPLYKRKDIKHSFITDVESLFMVFDAGKIEMLIGNLLSNTFKHTQEGGECYMEISSQSEYVVVDVFNTGPLLSEKQKTAIFQPYNRTTASETYSNSGIGLAIVNSIARLLSIKLSVVAVADKGNIFRAEIPVVQDDKVEISNPVNRTNIVDRIIDNTIYIEEQVPPLLTDENLKSAFQILIVENDVDTKKVIKKKLQKYFKVLIASTGNEALLLMKSQNVDVVISDIHMPEMDGYELCHAIKESDKTKHIPVILFTSDLSTESKIKGFRFGADAFLQKPINIQELFLRLENILKNKIVLRAYYSDRNKGQFNIEGQEVNNADEIFVRELTEYIYDHLSDIELSVQQLAKHMNISRTQLYLNIKRLTGQTPSMLVLSMKMAQAEKMMLNSDMTSSEISYKLGYCNPNHFSRQFKEFYDVSPSEFRKRQKK